MFQGGLFSVHSQEERRGNVYDQSLHMVLIDMVLMPEVPELTGFSITLSIVLLVAYEGQPEAPRG